MIALLLLNACEIDNTLDKIVDTDTPSTMLEVDPLVLSFGQVAPGEEKVRCGHPDESGFSSH